MDPFQFAQRLGVPPVGTPERAQFNLSFWASFWSGVFYSIFTGLFVGLAVWAVQKYADDRRQRIVYERELSIFKEKLRTAVTKPLMVFVDADAQQTEPKSAVAVMELVSASPVDAWANALARQRPFFAALQRLRLGHAQFQEAAGQLGSALVRHFRNLNSTRGLIAANDPSNIAYFLGRIQGGDPGSVKPWVPFGNVEGLEADYTRAVGTPDLNRLVASYIAARLELVAAVAAVAQALR